MTAFPRRLPVFLAALAVLALAAVPAAGARGPSLEGTEVFRRILFDSGFTPLTDFGPLGDNPGDTILILLGETAPLLEVRQGLRNYLAAGGAALIATDRKLPEAVARQVRQVAGVEVGQETLICMNPDDTYHNLNYCPLLKRTGVEPDLFHSPDPEDKRPLVVATNVPSWLVPTDKRLLAGGRRLARLPGLARLPPDCQLEKGAWGRFPEPPLFAVGGNVGKGRILVLADHSIFINQMMAPLDNKNVEFTFNCLNWLSEEKRRTRVLLVDEGEIRKTFDVPLRPLPLPPLDVLRLLFARRNELLAEANKGMVEAEESNAHNQLVQDWLDDRGVTSSALTRLAVGTLTLALLLYGAWRVAVRGRVRTEPAVPLLGHAVAGNLPAAPVHEQRHRALLQEGNLWEAAREAARQWFAAAGLAPAGTGPRPDVAVRGGWWRRWRLRRQVGRLWRLAGGSAPVRVSRRGFRRLVARLRQLRAEVDGGGLRLGRAPGS
jgi:hypothetical protein